MGLMTPNGKYYQVKYDYKKIALSLVLELERVRTCGCKIAMKTKKSNLSKLHDLLLVINAANRTRMRILQAC